MKLELQVSLFELYISVRLHFSSWIAQSTTISLLFESLKTEPENMWTPNFTRK